MIRTKGEAGTGNVVEAVRHLRLIQGEIASLQDMNDAELQAFADEERTNLDLVLHVRDEQCLPVVTFVAGGIATPADAALMMQMGAEGVFVGSGIFKSSNPAILAKAVVEATTHFNDPQKLAEVSEGLGELMPGLEMEELDMKLADRGH